jgi:hypothetical protein
VIDVPSALVTVTEVPSDVVAVPVASVESLAEELEVGAAGPVFTLDGAGLEVVAG